MVTIDLRNCKTPEDVEKVFQENKEVLGSIKKFRILVEKEAKK
jgi:hypothetical protein